MTQTPPRLVVGAAFGDTRLANRLAQAGHSVHTVDPLEDPGQIQHVDLVLLDGDAPAVSWAADKFADYARPRQMFLHTALAEGPQLLDPVETRHAIVMCAHNLFGDVWVTAAADELGETVVGLLVAELGGTSIPVQDHQRPKLEAAQRLRELESTLRSDAFDLLSEALPAMELLHDQFYRERSGQAAIVDTKMLDRLAAAMDDPGVRRLFVDVERRRAEQARAADVELWAIARYERGRDGV